MAFLYRMTFQITLPGWDEKIDDEPENARLLWWINAMSAQQAQNALAKHLGIPLSATQWDCINIGLRNEDDGVDIVCDAGTDEFRVLRNY